MQEICSFVNGRCLFRNTSAEVNVLMLTTADLAASGHTTSLRR